MAYLEPQVDGPAEPLGVALERLLPAAQDDPHFDLTFVRYKPLRPLEGKLKAENLLWHSLREAGLLEQWREPLLAIQAGVGRGRTLWGVVDHPSRRGWELRLLRREAEAEPELIAELRRTLAPWLGFCPELAELPSELADYQVLGLRFDAQTFARGIIDTVELHRRGPNPREMTVTSLDPGAAAAPRTYAVFETKREIDEVLPRLRASAVVDLVAHKRLLGQVLIPELFACRRLHISAGAELDTLVFSGVNVEQLLWFVRRFGFPEATAALLDTHREGFEQLLFDVQLSYRFDPERGTIEQLGAGYYGVF
ncbi:MAG: hypothetical protein R6X02_08530 [Enhygromyxa sp.]